MQPPPRVAPPASDKPAAKTSPPPAPAAGNVTSPGAAAKTTQPGADAEATKPGAEATKPGAEAEAEATSPRAESEATLPSRPAVERAPEQVEPAEPNRMTRRLTTRLGQILLDDGLLTESDLDDALNKQRDSGERLGALLVNEGYIAESALLSALETQYGVPAAALDEIALDPTLADLLPREMAERSLMVPIARRADAIDVAMVDPTDFVAMAHIRFATGLRPNVFITTVNGVRRTIDRLYGEAASPTPKAPQAASPMPGDARRDIKRMILDRDSLLMAADEDPRKFYQAAATIDAFVDEIMRRAKRSSD